MPKKIPLRLRSGSFAGDAVLLIDQRTTPFEEAYHHQLQL
jgi:hypothetical protein